MLHTFMRSMCWVASLSVCSTWGTHRHDPTDQPQCLGFSRNGCHSWRPARRTRAATRNVLNKRTAPVGTGLTTGHNTVCSMNGIAQFLHVCFQRTIDAAGTLPHPTYAWKGPPCNVVDPRYTVVTRATLFVQFAVQHRCVTSSKRNPLVQAPLHRMRYQKYLFSVRVVVRCVQRFMSHSVNFPT